MVLPSAQRNEAGTPSALPLGMNSNCFRSERSVRFVSLVARLLGHADRVAPSRRKSTGLMLPVPRKGAGSMAAHLAPTRVRSEHQRLDHFVADAAWSDVAVLAAVRGRVPEAVVAHSGVPDALLIDDTGPPKQGTHSLRVARQNLRAIGQAGALDWRSVQSCSPKAILV